MPKYRLLTKEELVQFDKEFIEYLVVNGITGEEWKQLKENEGHTLSDYGIKKDNTVTMVFRSVFVKTPELAPKTVKLIEPSCTIKVIRATICE